MEMHEASLLEDISHKIWIAALSTGRQHLQLSKPLLESGKHDECLSIWMRKMGAWHTVLHHVWPVYVGTFTRACVCARAQWVPRVEAAAIVEHLGKVIDRHHNTA
eukprot:1162091-Pelagomonas_calceolata.AAC.1